MQISAGCRQTAEATHTAREGRGVRQQWSTQRCHRQHCTLLLPLLQSTDLCAASSHPPPEGAPRCAHATAPQQRALLLLPLHCGTPFLPLPLHTTSPVCSQSLFTHSHAERGTVGQRRGRSAVPMFLPASLPICPALPRRRPHCDPFSLCPSSLRSPAATAASTMDRTSSTAASSTASEATPMAASGSLFLLLPPAALTLPVDALGPPGVGFSPRPPPFIARTAGASTASHHQQRNR